jgi:5-methylcytosine-specific restriction enzyme A
MRREFPKQVKRDAFLRANGRCENKTCRAFLTTGKFHYDHDIADALGGEPTLDNCVVLCFACHGEKTRKRDVPTIAKTKRIQDRQMGIKRSAPKLQSRGFEKRAPQNTASRTINKWHPA